MRVTSQTMTQSALRNLQGNLSELARLQDRASSQKAITRPSDDPAAAAAAMRVRGELQATKQYGANISDGQAWLTTVDSALAASTSILVAARDLTIQGANTGSLSPAAREAIATEIEALRGELLGAANTEYLGRSVFAGTSDAGVAFTPALAFTGSASGSVDRRIGPDATVRVDADGAAIFGTGTDSAFALLDQIAADLRSGTTIGARLTALDDRIGVVIGNQAEVGTRDARIQKAGEANMEHSGALEAQRSGVEDVDLARAILDLQMQETSYQAALAVTARVLQPTLMDFLR